jgi:solute carrier family 35 protein F5
MNVSHFIRAPSIAPAMFLADYAYNRGLRLTSVASSTVLVSTTCVFVYFLSILLRLETLRVSRLLGVLLVVAGTALTTLQDAQTDAEDKQHDSDTLYGDVFSLMAAVAYAAYSVQARVLCPEDEDLYSMPLLMGYVGLLCSVPLLPTAMYHLYYMDSLSFDVIKILILKGLLDFVVTDYLMFRSVMYVCFLFLFLRYSHMRALHKLTLLFPNPG